MNIKEKLQEAYEAIRAHFMRPEAALAKTSLEEREHGQPACVYRKDHDPHSPVRCPVGVRIPDELYVPGMDNTGPISVLLDHFPALKESMGIERASYDDPMFAFLARAQGCHDGEKTTTVERLLELLDELARENGLNVPA